MIGFDPDIVSGEVLVDPAVRPDIMADFMKIDEKLPSVSDTHPRAVEKLAELLYYTVGFEIPGFGIDAGENRKRLTSTHHAHNGLLLRAALLLKPEIYCTGFPRAARLGLLGGNTMMHSDGLPNFQEVDEPKMELRLHTAGKDNGAIVRLAQAQPGYFAEVGDRKIKDGELVDYCYDDNFHLVAPSQRCGGREAVVFDPLYLGPTIYKYKQNPMDSVVFCSMTMIGPSTLHGFWRPEITARLDHPREVAISDLQFRS